MYCPLKPLSNETAAEIAKRRNRMVSDVQFRAVSWSVKWANAMCLWYFHLQRNTEKSCWSAQLLDLRPSFELQSLRRNNHGRPGTRVQPGFTCKRWVYSVGDAFHFLWRQDALSSALSDSIFRNFLESDNPYCEFLTNM